MQSQGDNRSPNFNSSSGNEGCYGGSSGGRNTSSNTPSLSYPSHPHQQQEYRDRGRALSLGEGVEKGRAFLSVLGKAAGA